MGCWRGYLSGARCKLAYGPADATATHCLLLYLNPDWFCLLVPAHLGSHGQRAVKRVCVCVVFRHGKAEEELKVVCTCCLHCTKFAGFNYRQYSCHFLKASVQNHTETV